eukprot:SAG22_NODE_187_length_15860_cov_44.770446_2_plen_99_part_00
MDDLEEAEAAEIKDAYARFLVMVNNWYKDSLRDNATASIASYAEQVFRHMDFFLGDPMGPRLRFNTTLALRLEGPTPSELLGPLRCVALIVGPGLIPD